MKLFLDKLALGTWALGGDKWGPQDGELSQQTLDRAFELGMRHWDTAIGYGDGHAESLMGKCAHGRRDRLFIATKTLPGKRADGVIKSLKISLRNLGTDYIDLFYLHWPRQGVDLRPHWELLEQARAQGQIRALGVSNFSLKDMEALETVGTIDAHQLKLSLLWPMPTQDIIPYCRERGIEVAAYSPLAQGILTGKFPRHPEFAENDHRPRTQFFHPKVWPTIYDAVDKLKSIAHRLDRPLHHLALQWVLQQPGVNTAVVGARTPQQLESNAAALDHPTISAEVRREINTIVTETVVAPQ